MPIRYENDNIADVAFPISNTSTMLVYFVAACNATLLAKKLARQMPSALLNVFVLCEPRLNINSYNRKADYVK